MALARKEVDVDSRVHRDADASLARLSRLRFHELEEALTGAYAYAVFPSISRASALLGVGYGLGQVFEVKGHQLIGYTLLVQLTLGTQIGGETYSEVVVFQSPGDLEQFKHGKLGLAAGAAATLVKAGAAHEKRPTGGTSAYVLTDGGLWLGVALGLQKTLFVPAMATRWNALRRILRTLRFKST